MMFKRGDSVLIKDIDDPYDSYGFADNILGWAKEFCEYSDIHSLFSVTDTHLYEGEHIIQLKTNKGRCKRGWWVPARMFAKVYADWIEDMPLEVSLT